MERSSHLENDHAAALPSLHEWVGIVLQYTGEHASTRRILDTLERLLDRPYRAHAILYGEPGTGKEGLARALHLAMHPNGDSPFVKVPGGKRDPRTLALHLFGASDRPGAIERAEGGTLFIDEVATLPYEVQARLSSALRGRFRRSDDEMPRACSVCVIGTTDHDLLPLIDAGELRHELYYRLSRIELTVPPLRERPSDIARSALWIGNRALRQHGDPRELVASGAKRSSGVELGEDALSALLAHSWPGNFRELDRVMERALMLYCTGDVLTADHIRAAMLPPDRDE